MSQVIGDAIAVSIVAFAISVSMAQLFAKKHNYEVDSNQELLAEGATNMVCANLNCYMMCVSLSRSVVCENLGCKSQINALFSGGLMLLVILFIASYFRALPSVSLNQNFSFKCAQIEQNSFFVFLVRSGRHHYCCAQRNVHAVQRFAQVLEDQ